MLDDKLSRPDRVDAILGRIDTLERSWDRFKGEFDGELGRLSFHVAELQIEALPATPRALPWHLDPLTYPDQIWG